jgi:GTP-binding protein
MLGVVSTGYEGGGFVAADIPGLIEGAADGLGLGHEFLRHVDRCRLLIHVVDISGSEGRDPIDDIEKINTELERYSPELASRPQIIAANKSDMLESSETDIDAFEDYIDEKGWELLYVSAATGEHLDELVHTVSERLKLLPPITVYDSEIVEEETATAGSRIRETVIRRENDTFYVEGEWLLNLMGQVNFDDYESLNFFQKALINGGVIKALEEKGCEDGHTVSIYDFEFEFVK